MTKINDVCLNFYETQLSAEMLYDIFIVLSIGFVLAQVSNWNFKGNKLQGSTLRVVRSSNPT